MTLYCLVAGIIFVVLLFIGIIIFLLLENTDENLVAIFFAALTGIGLLIGILLLSAIGIFQLAVVIFATVKAKEGQMYHYPFNLRLI